MLFQKWFDRNSLFFITPILTQPQEKVVIIEIPKTQDVSTSGWTAFKSGCLGAFGVTTAGTLIIIMGAVLSIVAMCLVCYICFQSIPAMEQLNQIMLSITPTPIL